MIRLFDAFVLANTKLRAHKIRTGITIGTAGIMFGVIIAGAVVVQGVFTSIESFSKEGLNNRSILAVGRMSNPFNVYQNLKNETFINDVQSRHLEIVAKKTAVAKKYNVPYDAAKEDPSPVSTDETTGKHYIDSSDVSDAAVVSVAKQYAEERYKPFDIKGYVAAYPSAHVLDNNSRVSPLGDGSFEYMYEGKERGLRAEDDPVPTKEAGNEPTLVIMNQSIVEPFINKKVAFDPSKGEIPVVIPFSAAEQLLGLKPLPSDADTRARYERLAEVRNRIGEATATFCYRNAASTRLVQEAESQRKDFEKNGAKKGYIAPDVTYKPVSKTDCGAVEVANDTRTAFEKAQASRYTEYQKELGVYPGDPVQYKVTVRAVGISKDAPGGDSQATVDVSGLVESLLGSWLGFNQWVIPPALLKQVPEQYRPSELFHLDENKNVNNFQGSSGIALEEYLVEFGNANEARAAMRSSQNSNFSNGEMSAYPFGSSALLVAEAKDTFTKILWWTLIGVGGVAIIILGSMIGRTVAEGRREGAVFRAIGARRSDIGGIYAMYAVLLSIRVVLFALVLGAIIALTVEVLFSESATLGARYAYASVDTPSTFHFIGINSWYVPAIAGVIIVVGLVASIIPIISSARRNPIKDMRDDT